MQRSLALLILLVAGMLSLPLAAAGFDENDNENWILPLQLGGMAVVGALVALVLPGLVRDGSSTRRKVLVGGAIGVGMAVVGVAVFFFLLNGFDGA